MRGTSGQFVPKRQDFCQGLYSGAIASRTAVNMLFLDSPQFTSASGLGLRNYLMLCHTAHWPCMLSGARTKEPITTKKHTGHCLIDRQIRQAGSESVYLILILDGEGVYILLDTKASGDVVTMFSSLILLWAFFSLLFYLFRNQRPKNFPPGPRIIPIFGNMFHLSLINPLNDFRKVQ